MTRSLCASCRRKPANYFRSASGKPLCTSCLEKSLSRAIKRGLRGLGILERGSTIAVVPSSLNPYGLHVTLRLLKPSAEAAGAKLVAVAPPECGVGIPVKATFDASKIDVVDILRLERVYAAEAARLADAHAALLPVDATTLSALAVEYLLSGKLDYLVDVASTAFTVRGVKVAYSLSNIESEAVAAYAALTGGKVCTPPWRPIFKFHYVFKSLTRGRGPELLYGGLATARQLSETIARGGTCGSCGAPGYEGSCPTCSRLGLNGFRLLRGG